MNTPLIITERLILRKFTKHDIDAIFLIFKDEKVNEFLPWYPLKNKEDAMNFYKERYELKYKNTKGYEYALCLKENDIPIGYVSVSLNDSHELGYGLCREFWGKGIISEAVNAIIKQVKKDGLTYISATHDKNNIKSGNVLKRIGMKYCYSYKEYWKPKNFYVVFRMYQLNFNNTDFVHKGYLENKNDYFIEDI